MISAGDFRPGMVVEIDGDLYAVVEFQHNKRGRGTAVVRARVRSLRTGAITERTFMPEERYPQAYLDRRRHQYLYRDGDHYVFMDQESYDQFSLTADFIGDGSLYLKENAEATVVFHEGRPIALELPNAVELEVAETAPGFRGDTVAGGTKPARLETGAVVQVPFFVEQGDRIRVDTRSGAYLERVK
ncbi:MAG: elongation factor P [Armatimonadetes bacterium]|nr:elongation factor P [Armatimonadota bacterium]